ncbi:MAG: SIMPL domain-containing protein [Betaproteobacteria bacterium]|nr:SIMPL domain-containing protein [Betaproteobacteria bacterium]
MTCPPPTLFLLPLLAALAAPAGAATVIELSAEASRAAANDLARATVFAEAVGATPGELSKRVNAMVADGLKTAKGYADIKTQSAGTYTYPVYAKGGKIESWRMRSELAIESGDTAALSELLGKLQATLGVGNLTMLPAPETRKKAENEAILDAITAFRSRAKLVADALGKPYRIKQLAINSSGRPPVAPMIRAGAAYAADAAPMPIEGGDSQIGASVSGQIELVD